MSEVKATIACPKCYQVGEISPELLGDEVDCPKCNERFVAVGPRNEHAMRRCPKCDSDKIIPSLPLPDHYSDVGAFTRQAEIEIQGAPKAWVFKDETKGQISLSICGECGYAELRVSNAQLLWAAYQRSHRETQSNTNQ